MVLSRDEITETGINMIFFLYNFCESFLFFEVLLHILLVIFFPQEIFRDCGDYVFLFFCGCDVQVVDVSFVDV